MKVSIIQLDIKWADVSENIRRADALIGSNPGADLSCLKCSPPASVRNRKALQKKLKGNLSIG